MEPVAGSYPEIQMPTPFVSEAILADLRQDPSSLSRQRTLPLARRLYLAMRRQILDGALVAATRLPGSRELAADLGLSRNTVLAAINQLLSEGYLVARQGSGTFVSDTLPDAHPNRPQPPLHRSAPSRSPRSLSKRGQTLTSHAGSQHFEVQPFVPNSMDLAEFPTQLWQRLQNKYWRYLQKSLLDYGQEGGYRPLREAIARYLTLSRAVSVQPEQVLITSGTQQAIDLCARLLTDHGDVAWVEDPCYWAARRALEAAGLRLQPIAVDEEGICPKPSDWQARPRLIYTTPSHQYPLGHVMSGSRRRSLLQLAAQHRSWIFEDDYDSEFRYSGSPFASLQGLDEHAQVLYAGTFSKVMYPGMRLGYLVVPTDLVERFNAGLYDLYRPGQLMLQAALADFIQEGHFAALIRRLRVSHKARRDELLACLRSALGRRIDVLGQDSGLHVCLRFPELPQLDDEALARWLEGQRLQVRPLSRYYIGAAQLRGLVLGYAYVPEARLRPEAERLAQSLKRFLDGLGPSPGAT